MGTLATTVEILDRLRCACGWEKPKGLAVCRACYRELPDAHRKALYRRHDKGFVEAYNDTVEWLRANAERFKIGNSYWDGETLRMFEEPKAVRKHAV